MADEKPENDTSSIQLEELDDIAGGAVNTFLKIDAVDGESTNHTHSKEID